MKNILRRDPFRHRLLPGVLFLFLALATTSLQAQTTLLFYRLNNTDSNSVASGIIPNYLGTLGAGTNGGTGITLTNDIPTNGVPPGSGNRAFDGHGTGGVRSQGLMQLNRTNISNAGGFTYEAWFKYNGGSGYNSIIDYAGTEKLIRHSTDPGPAMEINNATFDQIGAAAANQWHYAAVVFTATNTVNSSDSISGYLTFYLDTNTPVGAVSNVTITSVGDSLNRTIGVGIHPTLAVDFFNGFLYEPRVTLGALQGANLLFKPSYVVTNANDTGPGSLRYAVTNAPSGAVITFAPALSGQTILLTSGQIILGNNITIDGSTLSNGIAIDGGNHSRIFTVNSGITVALNSLTLTNGNAVSASGGAVLLNPATLAINNCSFVNNHVESAFNVAGGAILNNGTLTINNSTFIGNSSDSTYGAGNQLGGGAIFNEHTLTMNNTTFSGNHAYHTGATGGGGAIYNESALTAINCTFLGDSDGQIDGNEISHGNNLLTNCIIAGASSSDRISFSSPIACLFTNNPLLAPIGNYGGPTQTMPPLPGSPAVDAGVDSVTNFLLTDQPGYPRLSGSHVDIGAAELQTNTVVNNTSDNGAGSLRYIITNVPPNSLVTFATGLSGHTITLGSEIVLSSGIAIDGSSLSGGIFINGANATRLFTINNNVTASLLGLTLTGGNGVGAIVSGYGGAILNLGNLTVASCTIASNNVLTAGGGAIENSGNLTVQQSTLSANNAAAAGGAIDNYGTLAVQQSAIANNFALYYGGAIDDENASSASLSESTLAGNTAGQDGGAIANYNANLTLLQCTLANNQTTNSGTGNGGGAINCNVTTMNLSYCILAGDSAASGFGPEITTNGGGSSINATNCLISNGANSGITNGVNANLVGSPASRLDAKIAPLGNYGGSTPTMPPLPGSPAIDAATYSSASVDQRGYARPVAGNYGGMNYDDIGAVESEIAYVTNAIDGDSGSLRQLVADSPAGGIIGFAPGLSGDTLMQTNEIVINQSLLIDADNLSGGITLSGGNSTRIFYVAGSSVFLSALQLTEGNGYGVSFPNFGGAICNNGDLTLDRCTMVNNNSEAGGAVCNFGNSLTVNQCSIEGNSSSAEECGGILSDYGIVNVNQSTIISNASNGILFGGGGGITVGDGFPLNLSNSIVELNSAPANHAQNVYYTGAFNSSDNLTNGNPQLASLGNYGGPTPTMPPLPGSPAVDAGNDSFTNVLFTDQRGYPRLAGAHLDIGAVEGVYVAAGPGRLTGTRKLISGSIEFGLTNLTDANFPVLSTTNVSLPLSEWTQAGFATENPPGSGQYQFTDPQATNNLQTFYRIRSP